MRTSIRKIAHKMAVYLLAGLLAFSAVVLTVSLPVQAETTSYANLVRQDILRRQEGNPYRWTPYGPAFYYENGMTKEEIALSDQIALIYAEAIVGNPAITTDFQRVQAATAFVNAYCRRGAYACDPRLQPNTPYGVFVSGVYTDRGATRALGRVLQLMGFEWNHANDGRPYPYHQFCRVYMDGQLGYADPRSGLVGYGSEVDGFGIPGGGIVTFK